MSEYGVRKSCIHAKYLFTNVFGMEVYFWSACQHSIYHLRSFLTNIPAQAYIEDFFWWIFRATIGKYRENVANFFLRADLILAIQMYFKQKIKVAHDKLAWWVKYTGLHLVTVRELHTTPTDTHTRAICSAEESCSKRTANICTPTLALKKYTCKFLSLKLTQEQKQEGLETVGKII